MDTHRSDAGPIMARRHRRQASIECAIGLTLCLLGTQTKWKRAAKSQLTVTNKHNTLQETIYNLCSGYKRGFKRRREDKWIDHF